MSEATPLAPLVALHFDLRPRTEHDPPSDHATVAQMNFQREGGPLTSFDPEQLPDLAKQILGEALIKASETLTTQAQILAAQEAELKAKDANAQELLAQVEEGKAEAARVQALLDAEIRRNGVTPEPVPDGDAPHEEPNTQSSPTESPTPAE